MDKIIKLLEELADKEVSFYQEGFVAEDFCGGNVDDAWTMGMEDGRVELAQEIITEIKELYYRMKGLEK